MITKNSGKATVSKILRRDKKEATRDIPKAIVTQLEEHTEGFILFAIIDGQLSVRSDNEKSFAKSLGLQILAKDYLETIIGEQKDAQRNYVLEHIDEM